MLRAAARPNTMLAHLPASRLLACSLRRQGTVCTRALCVIAAAEAQSLEQQAAPAAAVAGPLQRLSLVATSPTATQLLAHFFACELNPADCYLLYGSVGAGKSYFSRAFIRAAADDDELPVPSPTFLLQNIYTDHEGPPIHHFDLYRLTERYDLARLDLPASFSQAVCLVEWAERLALLAGGGGDSSGSSGSDTSSSSSSSSGGGSSGSSLMPADHLEVHISILEGPEQAALQQRLEQQQRQRQRGWQQQAGGSSGSYGPGVRQQAEEEGTEEEEEEAAGGWSSGSEGEEEGEEEEGSGDRRWRRVQLVPAGRGGGARWQPRLHLLRRYLAAQGAQLGCFLLEPAGEEGRQEGEQEPAAAGGAAL